MWLFEYLERVFFVAAADDVADGEDDFGESVDFVGDGQLEPFFYFSFELLDFFLVLSFGLTLIVLVLKSRPFSAVEQRQLVF